MWNWNIGKIINIFRWYIPLHSILNPAENTSWRFLFSWGQFCSCTHTKHVHWRWKPSPSYRSCHHISKKATLLSAFLTWLQFPSILALLSEPGPCQQLGVDEAKKKKERHLKLNLKMCFSWKPGRAAINQGRHFHAPHFSWFLSESPPFLHCSTVTYCCTGCRPWPAGHQWGGQFHPYGAGTEVLPLLQRLSWLILDGCDFGELAAWTAWPQDSSHHPSRIIHSLETQSWWPPVTSQELKVLPPTDLVLMWPWRKHFIADCRL